MEAEQFKRFITNATNEGVVLYHCGHLDQALVISIGATLRRRLRSEGAGGAQARKVFATFMEMAQNVVHYAAVEPVEGGRFGALAVVRNGLGFAVVCGNFMDSRHVQRVRKRLEEVQAMGPEMLRLAYRRRLAADDGDEHSKGAGLGLLTMAASAKEPLAFTFDPDPPDPDGTTFLCLKALV